MHVIYVHLYKLYICIHKQFMCVHIIHKHITFDIKLTFVQMG